MSDSGGVTLDSVVINIETQAGQSMENINNLAASLEALKKSVKGGFSSLNNLSKYLINLNKSTSKISDIATNVKGIGQVTSKLHLLSRVDSPKGVKHAANYLENLAKSSTKVAATGKNLASIASIVQPLQTLSGIQKATGLGYAVNKLEGLIKIAPEIGKITKGVANIPQLVEPLQTLSKIEVPRGLGAIAKHLNALYSLLEKITPDALLRLTRVSNELAVALTPLADKLASIGNGFSKLQALADKYGISATRVVNKTSDVKQETADLTKQLNKMTNVLKKTTSVVNSFGSKAVRHFKNLHSKLKQVALSLLGTRSLFTAVRKAISEYAQMDAQLTKQTTNLWRALGAQLAPAVEYVLYLFKQFTRVVYSFIYAVTGIDLIARANAKALASMGKSAKDALGSLQKFDDLNVAEFNKDSEENKLIDLDKIDLSPIQRVIDWVKKLKQEIKDAWNSGNWNGVAKTLADGINSAIGAIDPSLVGNAITNFMSGSFGFLTTMISNTDWTMIGENIREVFLAIDWSEIWNHAVTMFKEAFSGLDGFFDGLFGTKAGGEIALSLGGSFLIIKELLKLTSGEGFFGGLIEGATTLFEKTKQVGQGFSLLSKNTLTVDSISGITGVSKGLLNLLKPLSNVFGLITKGVASMGLGPVVGIIAAVVVGIMALIKAFKNLYENSEPFRQTVDGLIASIKDYLLQCLDNLKTMLTALWEVLVMVWQQVIVPLFDLIVSIVEPILAAVVEIIAVLWEDVLKPLGEGIMKIVMPAFKIIVDVIKSLIPVVKAIIDIIKWLWDQILEPIVKFLLNVLVGAIKIIASIVGIVIDAVVAYWENLIKVIGVGWGILKTGFLAIYNYIKDKVINPLLKLWDKLKTGWNKMWDGIKSGAKSAINWVLEKVENFINGIIKGINLLSSGFRKIGNKIFDIIGVDIKFEPLSNVSLPRLETGTNEVPYEGIYHLHQGEAVVPKKYNPALGNGTDEELGQKLDTLINIMNNMNFTNVVNIGNETLYKKQQKYNKMQNDKYGTTVNL